jgi:Ca2+/H+ antiporter
MVRHGAPLQLHVFFVVYNELSFAHSKNYALRMVFYPCILLVRCFLTHKTWHASSSWGVLVLVVLVLVQVLVVRVLVLPYVERFMHHFGGYILVPHCVIVEDTVRTGPPPK